MKRLLATTAVGLFALAATAQADEVRIIQNFDMARGQVQDVINTVNAKTNITGTSLEGTNIQNLLQWRDVSADAGDKGDIYNFKQYTDEAQKVINTVGSTYGKVGAELSGTNLMNVMQLEDTIGGNTHVGDHILLDQKVFLTSQQVVNTINAKGDLIDGSAMAGVNLANVADIVGAGGGLHYGDIVRLDQLALGSRQAIVNTAHAGSVSGVDMSAVNGVNIANFDLSDMAGTADIKVTQATFRVSQDIVNTLGSQGSIANAALSGVNLGNVITFAAE